MKKHIVKKYFMPLCKNAKGLFMLEEFNMKNKRLYKICLISVMSAISTVIYLILPEIPLVPGVDYLKLDFSDIPAIVSTFAMGPAAGIGVEIVKNALHLFRTTTMGIGELMNIGIGSAMVLSIYFFTRLFSRLFKKDKLSAGVYFTSAALTLLTTILAGYLCNAIFTPIFYLLMGFPLTFEAVLAGVLGSTLLNAVKAAFNILPFYNFWVV